MSNEMINKFVNNLVFKSKNITVLLGAGTSCVKGCNLPTGAKLFEDLIKEILKNEKYENIKDIINIDYEEKEEGGKVKFIVKSKDSNEREYSIETYLSKIENAQTFLRNNNKINEADSIKEFYKNCLDFIVQKIAIDISDKAVHKNFISKLISTRNELSKGRIKIFTTNYDTIIEDSCAENGIVVIDGFSFVGSKRIFNSSYFDYDIIDNNLTRRNNIAERIQNLLYLYKLHGSVNWYKNEDKFYCTNEYSNKKESMDTKSPMIIIPGDGKFKTSYDSPYLDMIGKFREGLCDSELLIIAGYSFSDTHINNIIVEAAQRNSNINILICIRGSNGLKCYEDFQNSQDNSIEKFNDDVLKKLGNVKECIKNCIILQHKDVFEELANIILTSKLTNSFCKFEESINSSPTHKNKNKNNSNNNDIYS